MAVITRLHIFGTTSAAVYSIERQKRGLPHLHSLIWLEHRMRPEQIDDIISAELPDREQDPVLFAIVSKQMIHGPCGRLNSNLQCMDNPQRKCSKRFPRPFVSETQTGGDGYPLYRRRRPEDGGHSYTIERSGITIDNSWVVPHCPLLSKMFNAHINVEYCNSVKAIKYICAYINKGCDMAQVVRDAPNRNDEISIYQSARYISSNEAYWRIFGFKIHDRKPPVVHLTVHLENGQRVRMLIVYFFFMFIKLK